MVATDLQGNLRDFERLLVHFEQLGPEGQLVITGDLVHGPSREIEANWPDFLGTPYPDESPALVDAFIAAQERAPGRVHCLLGNHDHSHIGGPTTAKFHEDEAGHLEATLGTARTERLKALIRTFPLIALAPNGAVMLHAAPSARLTSVKDFEELKLDGFEQHTIDKFIDVPVLGKLLWSRLAHEHESRRFLSVLGGTFALYGHDVVREGYEKVGDDQLCFSTSFGLFDPFKVYVQLDLSVTYPSVQGLRDGIEIKKLWG